MNTLKKTILVILLVFIAIQFIQPARNKNGQVLPADISKTYTIPDRVYNLLENSCYDCHSDNTRYPWYSNVQPVGWLIARDIRNAKAKLNFNEFGSLSKRKQASKLQEVANSIKEGTMPFSYYTSMHKSAKLSNEEKELIYEWIEKTKDGLLEKI